MIHQIRTADRLDQWRHCLMVLLVMEGLLSVPQGEAASTLAWLVAAGVDTIVGETPHRWLQTVATPTSKSPLTPPILRRDPAPTLSSPAVAPLIATTFSELATALAAFAHPLSRADTLPILLSGNTDSRIVILCDQPETSESPADTLRWRMLIAIGLNQGNCALLHRLPWPTTGARAPRADELTAFAPFVDCALALAAPRLVLAMGQHAAAIAGEPMGVASARGRWASVGRAQVPMLATLHPRLLLTQPLRKREAWADLQAFAERMAE